MTNLDLILDDDISETKRDGWSFSKFRVTTQQDAPQQTNGTDCGIYVNNLMEQRHMKELEQSKVYSNFFFLIQFKTTIPCNFTCITKLYCKIIAV
ncbi:Ulp1 protease family, C-terminal catalytic domain containing protein [Trema orientale]|uniref:Ulp1 protease family, C-terminal catalytic domain containing protein n=1 Tax=Trema orientale TaxID=63057 RepID=A0A2P5FTV3_TREOI|nr:Ulp1 protease family, C-terminal catalytic domain containing protein [Trema orientale]